MNRIIKVSFLMVAFSTLFLQAAFAQDTSEPEALCQVTGRFKPCVCVDQVPKEIVYLPTFEGCGGNAAVLTSGKYLNIFSVVFRNKENQDRFPASGFNKCNFKTANSKNPPNKCSAFKVQKVYFRDTENGTQRVNCFGIPGSSKLLKGVIRMTAKIKDDPTTNQDELRRWCLPILTTPLNN